jgi:hypothetical protein
MGTCTSLPVALANESSSEAAQPGRLRKGGYRERVAEFVSGQARSGPGSDPRSNGESRFEVLRGNLDSSAAKWLGP